MSLIDPRAIIDPTAILADDVEVGPWSIIGAGVEIGEGTVIGPHVILKGPTRIGKHNRIYQFSSVGEDTPDLKYKGEETRLVIGDHNVIREGVTIHRGTIQDRSETTLGDHNLVMAYAHIGHDRCVAAGGCRPAGANYSSPAGASGWRTDRHYRCTVVCLAACENAINDITN